MKRTLVCTLFLIATLAQAQTPVHYFVSFPNRDHHEAEVRVEFSDLPPSVLELRMSRSSPGRYALHEFAKNVYNFKARDEHGGPLAIQRPDLHQWNITGHSGKVVVTYTVFGSRADGTYLAVDNTHAHINMPATFVWGRGLGERPVEITFDLPQPSWKIATQLLRADGPTTYRAPNLDYFMDSPTEISPFASHTWLAGPPDQAQSIRLALHHAGTEAEGRSYARLCSLVVEEERAIFGELAPFDDGRYTFIADYLPYVSRDGMEHRNSTICTSTHALAENAVRNLSTISHEFFHSWNVERIRPAALQPFDFEHANMSGELWFAEGFTSYYDGLVLRRAGIISLDRYAEDLTRMLNPFLHMPGRQFFSAVEMSMQAPFVDAGVSIDVKNLENTFISYYTYGAALGLALDLTLRQTCPTVTLDDFMRAVWKKYGRTEQPYSNEDLLAMLAEVTGDQDFASTFFNQYIYGRELPDYGTLLAGGGFKLRPAHPGQAWLGLPRYEVEDKKIMVRGATLIGTPLYQAGVDRKDVILSLDGKTFEDKAGLEEWLESRSVGDVVEIRFEKNGVELSKRAALVENPDLEVVPFEHLSRPLSANIVAFRAAWLGSKSGATGTEVSRYCPVCRRSFPFRFEFCRYDGEKLELTRSAGASE